MRKFRIQRHYQSKLIVKFCEQRQRPKKGSQSAMDQWRTSPILKFLLSRILLIVSEIILDIKAFYVYSTGNETVLV